MSNIHYIKIDLLRFRVLVCFFDSNKAADEVIAKFCNLDSITDTESSAGYSIANYRRGGIWIGPKCKRSQIFHECWHMTGQILEQLRCSGKDDELNAHLNEFLCERVLSLWEKHKK